jgi:hypothetical protein
MSTKKEMNFKVLVLLVITSILFTGCQSPQVPTATPTQEGDLDISNQIQSTLNDYNTALGNNDKTLYMSTIDQGNLDMQESFSENFDWMESSGFPQTVKLGMTVINIEQKADNLVLAHIRRDRDGWQADWFFRYLYGKWVISEPTIGESGSSQSITSGNYTFTAYPIVDDMNQKIISLMPNAEEHVRKDLGKVPESKVDVMIYPYTSLSPLSNGSLSGWHIAMNIGSADSIDIVAPTSYAYGFYDPLVGWEPDFEILLTHELARIAYIRCFGNPGQSVDWFFEGLAEYVAGFDEMPNVIAAVQNDTIIPIIDTTSSDKKMDLAHFSNLTDWSLAYGLSKSLITFIVEKYGGLDTFWALAKSYDETQDMKTAIQNTLGISYEQFDTGWRQWLKDDYVKR